jgi:hypothetical protein
MSMIEVELLAREGNVAVVRLADRKFPGLLIQGDTMATMNQLFEALGESQEIPEEVLEVRDRLRELMTYYEAVLREHDIRLPY